jgi:4-hydroxy-tetrahydrodipicolinate reductase
MTSPIRIVIFGASGRMGKALIRLSKDDPRFHLVAAVTGRHSITVDADCSVLTVSQLAQLPDCDVLIDFSQPEAFDALIKVCQTREIALISGTTGINDMQRQHMRDLAQNAPVLWASNFSVGVAVLNDLVERAAKALSNWSVEITETHHIHKKDAPSGTALTLGKAVQDGGGKTPSYSSHREGEIIGDHTVLLSGAGEFIQLRHNALDRDIFAAGALEAAVRIYQRPAGLYQFSDLLFD